MLALRALLLLCRPPQPGFLPRSTEEREAPRSPDPRRAALIGLILTLGLVLAGMLLVHILGRAARLQDCVMAGRTNCAPIEPPDSSGR